MNDIHHAEDFRDTTLDAPPTARGSTVRKVVLVVAVLALLALIAWFLTPGKTDKAPGGRFAGGGPMPIVASPARTGTMPITLIGLGAVTPIATVTVQSQVSGQIVKVLFKEGQNVKPG